MHLRSPHWLLTLSLVCFSNIASAAQEEIGGGPCNREGVDPAQSGQWTVGHEVSVCRNRVLHRSYGTQISATTSCNTSLVPSPIVELRVLVDGSYLLFVDRKFKVFETASKELQVPYKGKPFLVRTAPNPRIERAWEVSLWTVPPGKEPLTGCGTGQNRPYQIGNPGPFETPAKPKTSSTANTGVQELVFKPQPKPSASP